MRIRTEMYEIENDNFYCVSSEVSVLGWQMGDAAS